MKAICWWTSPNSINQNLIASYNISKIESGESYTESISVANQTLDYLMVGLINNIDVEASLGLVPINYTDAISTKISITDIQIMEATAYFPDQLLHQEIVERGYRRYLNLKKNEHIVRLHIGLENPKDLIDDLKNALKHIK